MEEKKGIWNQIRQLQSIEEGKLFLKQEEYKQLPGGQVKSLVKISIKYICAVAHFLSQFLCYSY